MEIITKVQKTLMMFSDAFNGNFTQVLSKQLTCTLKKPTKVSNN